MSVLTPANQLTLLRMLLIPAFVILVVYGELGWALAVFVTAGVTDALDGLIARRSGQKTSLGAWLDPMADKLLLVTTFVVLTLPGLGLANRLPIWLTVLHHQPRRRHRADGGDREPGDRPADVPAVDFREDRDGHLHRDGRGGDVLQLPAVSLGAGRCVRLGVARHHAHLELPLHLARRADHRRAAGFAPNLRRAVNDMKRSILL